jgi:tRNA U38,U39,U40 pseudouridine synthase TruA|tara:strand:+ start:83 stop:253 length:171 start_codon:yes stop_codon:yes gene_type:complete
MPHVDGYNDVTHFASQRTDRLVSAIVTVLAAQLPISEEDLTAAVEAALEAQLHKEA